MSRLNLDAFKAQTSTKQIEELESLTGGILGACHCCTDDPTASEILQELREEEARRRGKQADG
jgi:hypothetical protein